MESHAFDESANHQQFIDPNRSEYETPPRGYIWISWILIIAMIALILTPGIFGHESTDGEPPIFLLELQGRYLVGEGSFMKLPEATTVEQIRAVCGDGPLRHQLIGIVLTGELVNLEKSQKELREIEGKLESGALNASAKETRVIQWLGKIQTAIIEKKDLEDALQPDLATAQTELRETLGWIGKLALMPADSPDIVGRETMVSQARRTLFVILGAFGAGVMAMIIGLILQITWWVYAATGRLSSGIGPKRGNGGIYVETFAVWMAMFLVISVLLRILPLPKLGLVWALVPQIVSLGALAWPVLRGVRWSDVRRDIGLNLGKNGWINPFVGIGTYFGGLPLIGLAMAVTFGMMAIASHFAQNGEALSPTAHPIVEPLLHGGWSLRWQLVFIAVFAAVPEEIMFRGVLYRHLREVGKSWSFVGSVAFSTFISSFVFAVIHPQGLMGIPILMSIAIIFALAREWRGSLVPSMIAHAMVNAGTSSLLLLLAD